MRGIKSKNHNPITFESNETSTSCFDDKIYILNDGINTLLYVHKDIPKYRKKSFIFLIYQKLSNDSYRVCEISA